LVQALRHVTHRAEHIDLQDQRADAKVRKNITQRSVRHDPANPVILAVDLDRDILPADQIEVSEFFKRWLQRFRIIRGSAR
jgi:hypothetical protein